MALHAILHNILQLTPDIHGATGMHKLDELGHHIKIASLLSILRVTLECVRG